MNDSRQTVVFQAKTEVRSESNGIGRFWLTRNNHKDFCQEWNTGEREPQSDICTYD